jgi:hypothetical protein
VSVHTVTRQISRPGITCDRPGGPEPLRQIERALRWDLPARGDARPLQPRRRVLGQPGGWRCLLARGSRTGALMTFEKRSE